MKTVVLALALLCASPAYAVVAHTKNDGGSCGGSRFNNMPSTCASPSASTTFTYTPNATGGAVIFGLGCAANGGTPSAVSLTATSWTTTQVGSITGTTALGWVVIFRAYAPNTSAATFTVTWTVAGNGCNGFIDDLIDEFSGADATNFIDNNGAGSGSTGCALSVTPVANDTGVWFACNDSVTAATSPYTIAADDGQQDRSEWKILSGGAGSAQAAAFTTSGNFTIAGATIKPAAAATTNCTRLLLGVGCDEVSP